jgi:hypothetical protein
VVTVYRLATLSWLPGLAVGAWAAGVPERYPLAALAFMGGYLGNSVCFHLQNPAWEAWFSEAVPDRDKGSFFGHFGTITGLIAGLVGLGGGWLVDRLRRGGAETVVLFGFLALFGLGALCGAAALSLFNRLRDIPPQASGDRAAAAAREGPGALWRRLLRQALTQRNYLRFILVYAWNVAINAGYTAFMIAWFKTDLQLGLAFLGALTAIRTLTVAASSRFWGELVQRFGGKNLMALGLWNAVFFPLGLFLYTPENVGWLAPVHWALTSVLMGAYSVAVNTLWYSLSGSEARAMQFALAYATYGVTGAIGPILGGYLISHTGPLVVGGVSFSRYHWLFLIAGVLQFVSLWLLRGLRERRSTPLRLVAAWVVRRRSR